MGEPSPRWEDFLKLRDDEVADFVRAAGTRVCVFPVNGTRRWYLLEKGGGTSTVEFLDTMVDMHIRLYGMLFDHGLDTLLTPIFGADILARPDGATSLEGMALLVEDSRFRSFYSRLGIRVRFYGEYRRALAGTGHEGLCDLFDRIATETAANEQRRLFYGVCAADAAEAVARTGVEFFQHYSRLPNRREIVEAYYGEYVEPVDLFIGFDKFAYFDAPLVTLGNEDLYFLVAPHPYVDKNTIRAILYDHTVLRRTECDYAQMGAEDLAALRAFYRSKSGTVLGVGEQGPAGLWVPKVG